jgi:hypothetical protein
VDTSTVAFFWRPADPYPFILLNLMLSCLAAIQAPIIMMSQNRQEAKDRLRAEHDYRVNLCMRKSTIYSRINGSAWSKFSRFNSSCSTSCLTSQKGHVALVLLC